MIVKISTRNKDLTYNKSQAMQEAIKIYKDLWEEKGGGEIYSAGARCIGEWFVDYRFGEDPYMVYEIEVVRDMQVNDTEVIFSNQKEKDVLTC